MPSTINGLIVFLVALIPGVPGEALYSLLAGRDWREKQIRRIIRIVLISVFGLLLYIPIAYFTSMPMPLFIVPEAFEGGISDDDMMAMAIAYAGHMGSAALVGLLFVPVQKQIGKWTEGSTYPSAWDDMLRVHVPGRWVIVGLKNGDGLMGILETAEREVSQEDRDLLIKEPAIYDREMEAYLPYPYQYLFIPAALIDTVAVVYEEDLDKGDRKFPVDEPIQLDHVKTTKQ